ncbi:MAG TPA: hypothetical protein VGN32_09720, partial [Ktedonobacterales bacterium]|nr:hypothetical protein [Ktedonobacterales bacterium]
GSDALNLIASLVREMPVRVLGAYRDTDVSPKHPLSLLLADLASAGLVAQQSIGPLSAEEASRMLGSLLAGLPNGARDLEESILPRAGGVPFFLVSHAQILLAAPAEARASAARAIPWDLHQSVRQRVEALPDGARQVLGAAAIIGRAVRRTLLVDVLGKREEQIYAWLDEASRQRLLLRDGDMYQFPHDVIQEVVEADLGAAHRASLHRRIAEAMERQTTSDEHARSVEVLAYHYGHSDADKPAARYLEEAGDRARDQKAFTAAQTYYHQAAERLDRLGKPLEIAHVHYKLGQALRLEGHRYDEAVAVLESAAAAYRAAGDLGNLARVAAEIGDALGNWGAGARYDGIRRLEEIRAVLEEREPPAAAAQDMALFHAALAQLYLNTNQSAQHLAALDLAGEFARRSGDSDLLVAIELRRGLALLIQGRAAESFVIMEQASELARTAGNVGILVGSMINATSVFLLTAAFDEAIVYARRAHALAERIGDIAQIAFALSLQAQAAFYTGAWAEARGNWERARTLSSTTSMAMAPLYASAGLGLLHVHIGDVAAGIPLLREALRIADQSNDRWAACFVQGTLAECDLLLEQPAEALARLQAIHDIDNFPGATSYLQMLKAWASLDLGDLDHAADAVEIAMARATQMPTFLVDVLWVRARLLLTLSHGNAAEQVAEQALQIARRTKYALGQVRILSIYAAVQIWRGEHQPAQVKLREALEIAERLGAQLELARIRSSFNGGQT